MESTNTEMQPMDVRGMNQHRSDSVDSNMGYGYVQPTRHAPTTLPPLRTRGSKVAPDTSPPPFQQETTQPTPPPQYISASSPIRESLTYPDQPSNTNNHHEIHMTSSSYGLHKDSISMVSPPSQTQDIIKQTYHENNEKHNHKEKENHSKEKEEGGFERRIVGPMGHPTFWGMDVFDTLLVLLWLAAIGTMIWYTGAIVTQFNDAAANPTTSVSYEQRAVDYLPTVTICNWNAAPYDNTTNKYIYAPYNNITLISCSNLTSTSPTDPSSDCTHAFIPVHYIGISSNQSFTCWQFNSAGNNSATKTGYMGGFSVVFDVVEDYITMDSSYRVGIQITFGLPGGWVDADNEYNFIPVGFDSFYALQKQETYYLNGSAKFEWTATSTLTNLPRALLKYEDPITTLSDGSPQVPDANGTYPDIALADDQPSPGMEDGLQITGKVNPVAVTFGYHTLSAVIIQEQNSFPLEQFLGAFGGMIGLLMGIDCIKLFRTLFLIPSGCIEKSPRDAFEMVN